MAGGRSDLEQKAWAEASEALPQKEHDLANMISIVGTWPNSSQMTECVRLRTDKPLNFFLNQVSSRY
jgi:hypothetical protein